MNAITWTVKQMAVSEIVPLEKNPRTISDEKFNQLDKSLGELGDFGILVLDTDGVLLSGNRRLESFKINGVETVEVKVPSRKLTKREREKIILMANISAGEFDLEALTRDFNKELLEELEFTDLEFDKEFADYEKQESELKEHLKDADNIGLVRILTTKENAAQIEAILEQKSKATSNPDKGDVLLTLLSESEANKYDELEFENVHA